MTLTGGDDALLLVAGLGAGLANGAVGGGTLISFPALLAAGYPPLTANVTSTVGIWPGYIGGSAGFASEIADQRARLMELAPAMLSGAVVGGLLLLTTPSRDFRAVAPFLLLAAFLMFAGQPWAAAYFRRRGTAERTRTAILQAGTFLAATYGAYFGAGMGVVLLAILATALTEPLNRLNGLRSVMSLSTNTVAVLIFLLRAHIGWAAASLLAVSSLIGGRIGARVAQRVPAPLLRLVVLAIGLASAIDLLVT